MGTREVGGIDQNEFELITSFGCYRVNQPEMYLAGLSAEIQNSTWEPL